MKKFKKLKQQVKKLDNKMIHQKSKNDLDKLPTAVKSTYLDEKDLRDLIVNWRKSANSGEWHTAALHAFLDCADDLEDYLNDKKNI